MKPKGFLRKKQILLVLLYIIPSYFLVSLVMFMMKNEFSISMKSTDYCNFSPNITTINEDIILSFPRKLSPYEAEQVISALSLNTKWMKTDIVFKPGTAEVVSQNENIFTIRFFMPFVANYSATLKCGSSPFWKKYSIQIVAKELLPNASYSRILCHHDEYIKRWCESSNIALYNKKIYFFSPATFSFPTPFLAPGARAPPFDVETDRFVFEPIVQNQNISGFNGKLRTVHEPSYIYGGYYNYQQLWHTVFDFILPFYIFERWLPMKDTRQERRVYTRSQPIWGFVSLLKILSEHSITIIPKSNDNVLFKKVTLGIEKFEKDPTMDRNTNDSINFTYNFNQTSAPDFRNDVLDILQYPKTKMCDQGRPLVVVILRKNEKRDMKNMDHIVEIMKETCPFCSVEYVALEKMSFEMQVALVSKSSVLAGLHGSGLTHVMWLAASSANRSTHLLEFLPHGYWCRNWYETAANVSRVNYHPLITKTPLKNPDSSLESCYNNKHKCPTVECHDKLRDQPMEMDLETFNKTWQGVVDQIRYTKCSEK